MIEIFVQQNWWIIFLICFTVFSGTSLWMSYVAKSFHIDRGSQKAFSIFDLQLPVSEKRFHYLISIIPPHSKKALRLQLWIDFLFMAGTYPAIALLCYKTAMKMEFVGRYLFLFLAIIQVLPFIFDVIENIYVLTNLQEKKFNEDQFQKNSTGFNIYQLLVKSKFAIALTGTLCSVFGLLYFWLTGNFEKVSLNYLGIVAIEILLFLFLAKRINRQEKKPA